MLRKTILVVGALVVATFASSLGAQAHVGSRHSLYRTGVRHVGLRGEVLSRRLGLRTGRWSRGVRAHRRFALAGWSGSRRGASSSLTRQQAVSPSDLGSLFASVLAGGVPPTPRAATNVPSGSVSTALRASRVQTGGASYYSGGRTASGGRVGSATCAHRSLPFGTRVLVTNLRNAHQAVLTVNDRGPFVRGRIIDVSAGAAAALGMLHSGTASVRVEVVGGPG